MGYVTEYTIKAKEETPFRFTEEIFEKYFEEELFDSYLETADNSIYGESKWFGWRGVVGEFSKLYPEIVFIVEASGEDPVDLWKAYIKNGKVQIAEAKIIYDEYDETKLK